MKKVLLILLALLLIPSLAFAKEYRNYTSNFQLDLPDNWIVDDNNKYDAVIKTNQGPYFMIIVETKYNEKLKFNFNNEPDERLKELIVPAYINKIKAELPSAIIQSATVSSFTYNKGIIISFSFNNKGKALQGADAYFVIDNQSYTFNFMCQPENSQQGLTQFLEILNTFRQTD